jgi:hypothetical protein
VQENSSFLDRLFREKHLAGKAESELEQIGLMAKNLSKIFAGPISPHSYSLLKEEIFLCFPDSPNPRHTDLTNFGFLFTLSVINMLSQYTMFFELLPELAGAGL